MRLSRKWLQQVIATPLLLAGVLACSSNPRPLGSTADGLTATEITFVAWWAEDIAHGGVRRAEELRQPQSSPALERLAQWARGSTHNDARGAAPPLLLARRQRWPLIAGGLQAGDIVLDAEGLPYLASADATTVRLLDEPIQAEREDRLRTLSTLLALGDLQPGSPAASATADALRDARASYMPGALDADADPR